MPNATPPVLDILPGEIHLWTTSPDDIASPDLLARYAALLSAEESHRQQRLKFERDRHAALVTRAFVRDLLSAYAPIPPEAWQFLAGANGKPEIIDPPLPLRFNLSHTRGMIICAVTLVDDIGCDVENIGRRNDLEAIARSHFSAAEQEEMFALPQDLQRSRFFDYWTLKESWIKACGEGIFRVPLADFSFGIRGDATEMIRDEIGLEFAPGIEETPDSWRSWLFYPRSEHRIAVTVKQLVSPGPNAPQGRRFRFFDTIPLQQPRELFWQFPA
ncbi:4'-phosphopantetheinyl transferase family protein [Haliea sp. E17]|uniref:4'-phosphopantetheinyl transferase family protein n=1 Tax=Haliea sp. E17 TaxID=3401576 RepID=UPI003AAF6A41